GHTRGARARLRSRLGSPCAVARDPADRRELVAVGKAMAEVLATGDSMSLRGEAANVIELPEDFHDVGTGPRRCGGVGGPQGSVDVRRAALRHRDRLDRAGGARVWSAVERIPSALEGQ